MTPQLVLIKLRLRLNKSHSSDYDLIPDWKAVEAINKAAIDVCRRLINGSVKTQDGSEETTMRTDDLQFLLKPKELVGVNHKTFFEANLPEDYLWYKRFTPIVSKAKCKNKTIDSLFVEEANVGTLIKDWSMEPSFEWEQTFHTLLDNKLRVYTNGDFVVNKIDAVYYRYPKKMDINGYIHENGEPSVDVDLEFKEDMVNLIISEAAGTIAGDIESPNQKAINDAFTERNI